LVVSGSVPVRQGQGFTFNGLDAEGVQNTHYTHWRIKMLKNFSVMKRKEGMSLEEFRHWALAEHVELGRKIPGMRHYRMNVVLTDNPTTPDAMSEMWFDDMDARNAAFATDEG